MPGPIITKLKNWWGPKNENEPDAPAPAPSPETPVTPEPPVVTPSFIPAVNYLRAFMILKKIPFKQLRAEFLKLPLKKIVWLCGIGVWAYMTYAIVMWMLGK